MVVKCPYGKKKGFAVYCELLGKNVSPLKYPCTSDHYQRCPIYQKHAEEKATEEERRVETHPEARPERRPSPPPPTKGAFKRPEEAENCYECIFYSELTKMCLKLKIRVDDPYNPPCKK